MKTLNPKIHTGWVSIAVGWYANGKGQSVVRRGQPKSQKWYLLGSGSTKGPFTTALKAMRSLDS